MATKIFLTDDHYIIIQGIRSLLQPDKALEWMGHAMSATSCLAFLQQNQPDVLLLDINLPDRSGIDLCREIKSLYPAVHIIGLSSFNQKSFIKEMLDNGASGYVLKNATREELKEAIAYAMQGRTFLSLQATTTVRKNRDSTQPVLTRREKEVLDFVANGLTNSEIAKRLEVTTATIDTHRKNLLLKFDVNNTATLIRTAVTLGYI
jgi:DNA-binding NarL/FixJ family response regulator